MFKKITLSFTCFICIFFVVNGHAQVPIIEGTETICDGACGDYTYTDALGNQPDDVTWQLSNGNIFNGNPIEICFSPTGDFTLTVFANGPNSEVTFDFSVTNEAAVELSSTAPTCQNANEDCETVCTGSIETYSVPAAAGSVMWEVTGSDDFTINGNELTVNWDTPGEGSVLASTEDDIPYLGLNCHQLQAYGDDEGGSMSFQIFSGTPPFSLEIIYPNGVITNDETTNYTFFFNNLEIGEHFINVTDAMGLTANCSTVILDMEDCDIFYNVEDNVSASGCGVCDGFVFFIASEETFTWDDGSTSTMRSDLCPGTYSYTVSSPGGCSFVETITVYEEECTQGVCAGEAEICVNILEEIEAKFSTFPAAQNEIVEICEGQSVSYQNQSIGGETFIWDFGDFNTSVETNPEHTYALPGTYNVSLITRNECFCSDTTSLTVNVLDADIPDIECVGTICEGEIVTYTSAADCATFNWSISGNGVVLSGGGTNDDFVEVEWGTGPLGTVSLSVDNCTGNTCTLPNVESIPIISDAAEIEGLTAVCNGSKSIYSLPKYDGTDYAWIVSNFGTIVDGQNTHRITVEWNGTVPNTSQFVSVEYENCYLECGGSDVLEVSIVPEFYATGVPIVCEGTSEFFFGRSYPDNNAASLNWELFAPDGSLAFSSTGPTTSAELPFNSGAGTYRLVTTAANPNDWCTDSYDLSIVVDSMPVSPSGIIGENSICVGNPYTYTANSMLSGASFIWEITDGTTVTNRTGNPINITWTDSGIYQVSVAQIDTEGLNCQSAFATQIVNAITEINIIGEPDVCLNDISTFTATNYDDLFYNWTINPSDAGVIAAGEGSNQVDIFWTNNVNATVSLELCGQTIDREVTVRESLNPGVNAPDRLCEGEVAPISTSESYDFYTWKDEFGITVSNASSPSLASGYYELVVTDEFGCSGNTTFQIGQFPTPEVSISTADDTYICLAGGDTWPRLFAENTNAGYIYKWYLNNNAIDLNSAIYQTSEEGAYRVEVVDVNGCMTSSNTIFVNESCIPGGGIPGEGSGACPFAFNIIPTAFCNTFTFEVDDANPLATYEWFFDDGNTSTEAMPSHSYARPGFYNVYLLRTVIENSQIIICVIENPLTVPIVADFSASPSCPGQAIQFTDLSSFIGNESISSYAWDFGDAGSTDNTSNLANPTHIYNAPGVYTASLTITGANGCISVKTEDVEIIGYPEVNFAPPAVNCAATSLLFIANTAGNVTDVLWNFGDISSGISNTSNSFNPYHKFSTPGFYTVTLTGTSIYACSESFSQTVTIEPNALNGNITAVPDDTFCAGESATLTAPAGGVEWFWSTGENTENINVSTAEIYSVTIVDASGCAYASAGLAINVLPLPQADIYAIEYDEYGSPISYNFTSYEVCEGEDVFLEIEENSSNSYVWSTGTIGISEEFSEDKGNQLTAGVYDIEVVITNEDTGCTSISAFEIIVNELPQNVTILSDSGTPICANTNATFSVQNPDPTYTYIWNTDEEGTSIIIIAGGEYWVTAYNQFGCEAESNHIEVENAPDINKIPDGCHTRCAPDTICLPPLQNIASYQWFYNGVAMSAPNGTQADVIAEESGEYYLVMEDVFGCTSVSDVLSLDLFIGTGTFSGQVYYDTNENGIIDAGDELLPDVNINLLDVNGVVQDVSTSNTGGEYGFPDISSIDYILELDTLSLPDETTYLEYQIERSITGCDHIFYQNWLVVPICQTITESLNLTSCDGNSINYEGNEIAIGESLDIVFKTAIGCDSIVTVSVEDASSAINIQTLSTCIGESIEINGIEIGAGETELFTFTNQAGCDSLVEIIVIASPSPNILTNTTESCWSTADGTISITPPTIGNAPFEYALDGGNYQTELSFENLTGTVYTINIRDANGCIYDYDVEVPTVPNIQVEFENQIINCDDTEIELFINASGGRGDFSYQWETGETSPNITITEAGIYPFSIEDECGIFNTEVEVENEVSTRLDLIYFPTAFSPNGDGINDDFRGYLAENVELISYELMIFDRWGNLLAEIRDVYEGWEGDFRTKEMDTAVLVYVLQARVVSCGVERSIKQAGDVTLMR